jgi:Clp amino terminal domain, pathogenicity island component
MSVTAVPPVVLVAGVSGALAASVWLNISYVKTIRPQAGALENLSDAVNVAADAPATPLHRGRRAALRETVMIALRKRHNYIGTEHILLGILHADDDTGQRLAGLGLTADRAEQALADMFARIQASRRSAG